MRQIFFRYSEENFQKLLKVVEALYEAGELEEALQKCNQLDREFPNRKEVIYQRNVILHKLGRKTFLDIAPPGAAPLKADELWTEAERKSKRKAKRKSRGEIRIQGKYPETPAPVFEFPTGPLVKPGFVFDYAPERDNALYTIIVLSILLSCGIGLLTLFTMEPRPGTVRRFADIQFAWIPSLEIRDSGTTASSGSDGEWQSSAGTSRTPGFWMARYEMTRGDWARIYEQERERSSSSDAENLPKTNITPQEIMAFVELLNRQGEGHFRIPTQQEWIRACLAGSTGKYAFGDDASELESFAVYADNSESKVARVGSLQPNDWDLYDMHGNVAEWCIIGTYFGSATQEENATNSGLQYQWAAYGGSATSPASQCTASSIIHNDTNRTDSRIGFRICRDAGPSSKKILRVLSFPSDYSMGELYVGKTRLGDAQGEVTVLLDDKVSLIIGEDAKGDLAPLADFDPDDLYEIIAIQSDLHDDALIYLAHLTGLERLDFSESPVTDVGIHHLAALKNLTELNLSGTNISGNSFATVAGAEKLTHLSLEDVDEIEPSELNQLKALSELEELKLIGSDVTPKQLTGLQVALPHCTITPKPPPPTLDESLLWASVGGKYSMLLDQIKRPRDQIEYDFFVDLGFQEVDNPAAHDDLELPKGYWVYVYPYWYKWLNSGPEAASLNRRWGPEQAVGETTSPQIDHGYVAWKRDPGGENPAWLMLEFDEPVSPRSVWVHQLATHLGVTRLGVFDLEGVEHHVSQATETHYSLGDTEEVWRSILSAEVTSDSKGQNIETNRVILYLDSEKIQEKLDNVEKSKETELAADSIGLIDSVALVDMLGQEHWATSAVSSSFLDWAKILELEQQLIDLEIDPVQDPADIEYRGLFRLIEKLSEPGSTAP